MTKDKLIKVIMIALKVWIGVKFLMEGLEKFESLERLGDRSSPFLDFYRAMGETSYMLPTLSVLEILGGLLLITQRFSYLGSVLLLPIMLNVWMAHVFLIQSPKGITLTSIWFVSLILLIFLDKNRIDGIFRPQKIW